MTVERELRQTELRREADASAMAVSVGLAAPFSSATGKVSADSQLCREGTSSPYEEGFAYPDGLQRHLVGSLRGTVLDHARHSAKGSSISFRSEAAYASLGPEFDPVRREWKD